MEDFDQATIIAWLVAILQLGRGTSPMAKAVLDSSSMSEAPHHPWLLPVFLSTFQSPGVFMSAQPFQDMAMTIVACFNPTLLIPAARCGSMGLEEL